MKTNSKILNTTFIILLTTTILYTSISNSISKKTIQLTSNNLVKKELIYNEDKSYTDIFKTILKLTTLNEEYVIRLIKLDYVEKELTNIVDSIYEYNLTQDDSIKYTKNKIINLVKDNITKVTTDINYPITNKEKEEAIKYTEENIDYILNTIYQTNIGD